MNGAYALCLGQSIHIEVKPVDQIEEGLFATDHFVRRANFHCKLFFRFGCCFARVSIDFITASLAYRAITKSVSRKFLAYKP